MDVDQHEPTAIVAGGGRGIGQAIVERLHRDGCKVVAAARSLDELEVLAARGIHCHAFDITDNTSVDSLVQAVLDRYGRIDILVNAAGASYVAPVALSDLDKCEHVLQVNLMGAYRLSRAIVRPMIRRRTGRIIHIGSISGSIGARHNAMYAASKAGLAGLVRSLALEVATLGITVNAVQPGTVHTELFEQTHGARARTKGISLAQQKQIMEQESPIQRLVEAEEVAEAVAYLASQGAASVTGQLLNVDGGRSIA